MKAGIGNRLQLNRLVAPWSEVTLARVVGHLARVSRARKTRVVRHLIQDMGTESTCPQPAAAGAQSHSYAQSSQRPAWPGSTAQTSNLSSLTSVGLRLPLPPTSEKIENQLKEAPNPSKPLPKEQTPERYQQPGQQGRMVSKQRVRMFATGE